MHELATILGGTAGDMGFGGAAGAIVGYTAKKLTKFVALALGLLFVALQALVYMRLISVDWEAVQRTTHQVWQDPQGVTLAERAFAILRANLPFGGAFAAGFAVGFKLG